MIHNLQKKNTNSIYKIVYQKFTNIGQREICTSGHRKKNDLCRERFIKKN